jgi:hypothetical protein
MPRFQPRIDDQPTWRDSCYLALRFVRAID